MKELLKFNREEYRENARVIVESKEIAEKTAEEIFEDGFKNIFFVGVGGSLAPMMSITDMAKQFTTMPIFIEQANELLYRGNKNLNEKSLVITMSASGDTKETVAIAEYCNNKNIRVVCFTKNENSPLAKNSKYHIPMKSTEGVEYEYIVLYWFFFKILNLKGDFEDYEEFGNQLKNLPKDLERVKEAFEEKADKIARDTYDSDYMIWIGGNEMWGETYLFSMCILEEMQWFKTKSVSSSEFFHGTLELVDETSTVFLIKGSGKARVLDERVEKFCKGRAGKFVVIDPDEYALTEIDEKYRWMVSPLMVSTMLVDRLAVYFEKYSHHNLDYRRYYRQFDY